jgi:3-phenylpropionate/trans-cinnamate dioxygenase ferredoxin subunit
MMRTEPDRAAVQEVEVCTLEDLPPGERRRIDHRPPLAVFNVECRIYAIDDTRTHANASLSEGDLDGCFIECPYHVAQFDLRTGRPCSLPARKPVRTHRVLLRDGAICIQVGVPADVSSDTATKR